MSDTGEQGQTRPHEPGAAAYNTLELQKARDLVEAMRDDCIGEYRILRKIKQGGMGVVYEAEHRRLGQRVALKLIRPGLVSDEMLRRFEYEAKLLARLEHPGIARVYHAGIHDDGGGAGPRPYFAMEFVHGQPLDDYLAQHQANDPLTLRQRVELLLAICQAVEHAHSRGIVHRDLKPDNILITPDGRPKIIDFGVARAIEADALAVASLHTRTGALVGTVQYMAPEQVRGKVDELDHATDVYALGVVGFELLTGRMPYTVHDLPLPEVARVICEEEPSRLSSINRSLRGDVETIVGKALDKDKSRRYPTAGAMAADVQRYLDYEPITARPPSTWYNLRKFARRNKALVGMVTAILCIAVGAAAGMTALAVSALRARDQARREAGRSGALTQFMIQALSSADPEQGGGQHVTIAQALGAASQRIVPMLGGDPLLEAAAREAIGQSFHGLGIFADADSHMQQVLRLRRMHLGEDDPATRAALNNLAVLRDDQGRLDESEQLYRQLLASYARPPAPQVADTARAMSNFSSVLQRLGKLDEAEQMAREAVEQSDSALSREDRESIRYLQNLATVLIAQEKLAAAESVLRRALTLAQTHLSPDDTVALTIEINLGAVLQQQRKFDDAEGFLGRAYEGRRQCLGESHRDTLGAQLRYAGFLLERGDVSEAEAKLRDLLAAASARLGPQDSIVIAARQNLARAAQLLGKLDEAEQLCRQAISASQANSGAPNLDTFTLMSHLARVLGARGRFDEAEPLVRQVFEGRMRLLGAEHADTIRAGVDWGSLLIRRGLYTEAQEVLRATHATVRRAAGTPPALAAVCAAELGRAMLKLGNYGEAEPLLLDAFERLSNAWPGNPNLWRIADALANLYTETDRAADAQRWRARAGELETTTRPLSATAASRPDTTMSR
ncbi:tetratricopeptide repeat protein [Fontivita pretiosa]|uniref:serine/threonine-protein kinase n=1 Tax=Fontivita pretiosa TaxID=2989684 RepID=UPI003D16F945